MGIGMEKKFKVVSSAVTFGNFNSEPVERLEAIGCEVVLNDFGRPFSVEEFKMIASDADAIIAGNDKVNEEVISSLKKAKVIAKHGVGIDGINIEAAKEHGITVTNAPGTNKEEVADSAMAFMLLMARDLVKMSHETKAGRWIKYPTHSLADKTMGIIGAGNIGTAFARRSSGFGMKILAADPVEREEAKKLGVEYASFDQVIRNCDYLSVHCPLNGSTYKLFGRKQFEMMKNGVFIVNTARSQIFDYDDMYDFVKNRKIAGYSSDVFDYEPPAMHPLYRLSNVYLTPHVAGTTNDSNLRMGNTAADNVIAVLKHEAPPNLIEQGENYEDY